MTEVRRVLLCVTERHMQREEQVWRPKSHREAAEIVSGMLEIYLPMARFGIDRKEDEPLLDLSLRDHFSTGETTLVLLGTEATFLYELT